MKAGEDVGAVLGEEGGEELGVEDETVRGVEVLEGGGVGVEDVFEDEPGGEGKCVVEEVAPHGEGAAEEAEARGGVDFVFVFDFVVGASVGVGTGLGDEIRVGVGVRLVVDGGFGVKNWGGKRCGNRVRVCGGLTGSENSKSE